MIRADGACADLSIRLSWRRLRDYYSWVDTRALLLHQVHPAKLATDITAELVSWALLWQRKPVAGLLIGLVPPTVASALVLRSDLEPLAQTVRGRYVLAYMPPAAQAIRAAGVVCAAWGSWRRNVPTVLAGAVIIAAGWSFGLAPDSDQPQSLVRLQTRRGEPGQ